MISRTPDSDGIVFERRSPPAAITRLPGARSGCKDAAVVFTSHGLRLDNRAELVRQLGITPDSSDVAVILACWDRWGPAMAERLRGVFAFAIHDVRNRALYLARDPFGLAPLCYHLSGERMVLGIGSRVVRSLLPASPGRNMLMLADFLSGATIETGQTFFTDIHRLPAAHWMLVDAEKHRIERYWHPAQVKRLGSAAEADRRFREIFDQSVKHCFAPDRSALLLSGGLDSSAIAASLRAGPLPAGELPALSLTYRQTPGWHDADHLSAVSAALDIAPCEIPSDRHDPLQDMQHWLQVVDGPYLSPGHSVSFRMLPLARQMGYDVVLSGHGGDEIVSYGFGRLNELARAGRWFRLWREAGGAARLQHGSQVKLFRKYLAHNRFLRRIGAHRSTASLPPREVDAALLAPDLAALADAERYVIRHASMRMSHDERMVHEEALLSPIQPLSLEIFALCSRASGVECRLPFYDRDLAEYSLSLPSDWKLRDGYSRYVMRGAMAGRLPPATLWRQDKFDFSGNFRRGLLDDPRRLLELTDPAAGEAARFVNADRLQGVRQEISRNGTLAEITDAYFIWRVAILAMWLDIERQAAPQSKRISLEPLA